MDPREDDYTSCSGQNWGAFLSHEVGPLMEGVQSSEGVDAPAKVRGVKTAFGRHAARHQLTLSAVFGEHGLEHAQLICAVLQIPRQLVQRSAKILHRQLGTG